MKHVFLVLICLSMVALAAVRVWEKPVTHVQPDGSRVELLVNGDEFYRYATDADGYTVLRDPVSGAAVYAQLSGEILVPSSYWVGRTNPSSLGLQPGLQPSQEEIRRTVAERGAESSNREGHAPTMGTINNLVIFIRFLDQDEYTEPVATFDTMFNSSTEPSLKGFFLEESLNRLNVNSHFYPAPSGGVVRSFQDGHPRGYFSPQTGTNPIGYTSESQGKQRLWLMMHYAVNSISASIPSSVDLDADNDGEVDNIVFICQGGSDTWDDVLWPHQSRLSPYTLTMIGMLLVTDYNLQLSDEVHVGTACHEFSHSLNFPDLYHYDDNLNPVGGWDPMNAQSNPPQHHTTYTKHKYGGWFAEIPLITPTATATQYSLSSIDQNPYACYRIASTRPNEYYVLEYRSDTGVYESGVPASGLLVYRVLSSYNGSPLWGNPHGPPDEVYIYRPGVTEQTPNGFINNATLSAHSGRTDMYHGTDPSPWLYGDGSLQLPGNLVILNVGTTGGTSISFWIKDSSPNRWLGTNGDQWTGAQNWSHGSVPTVNEDVVIPATNSFDPVIEQPGQACKSLVLHTGAILKIYSGNLEVADNLTSSGRISLNSSESSLYVYDDLSLLNGSETTVQNSGAEIVLEEDLLIASGATVNWSLGYLEFSGATASVITCQTAAAIGNMRVEKSSGASVTLSGSSSADLTINGSLYVQSGTFYNQFTGNTVLKGSLNVYSGSLAFSNGTLSCEGSSGSTIRFDNPGSYLHKLRIAKSGTAIVSLSSSNLRVGSDLSLVSGFFSCAGYTLSVGGNWSNTAGVDNFYEGNGRVVLNGLNNQSVSSETFNILELNKSGRLMIPVGVSINCAVYDWSSGGVSVSGGSFTASDLADDGIFGSYTLSSGSISLTQDTGHYIDLRSANISISGGVFSIYGGGGEMWMSYQGTTTFTQSGGVFDVRDQDIFISSVYAFNDNITGGYIRTRGDLNVQRTDFNPEGGYIEFWGGNNASLFVASGSSLSTLVVNKSSSREERDYKINRDGSRNPLTRANTLVVSGVLTVSNTMLVLSGILDVNGWEITVNNDLTINGTLKMSAGSVIVWDNVIWNGAAQVGGGNISCAGNWTFGAFSTALLTGSQVILNNPYGGSLVNNSPTAGFGSLEFIAADEDPVYHYSGSAGEPLKVAGTLQLSEFVTLNLNSYGCQAQTVSIGEDCVILVGDGGSLEIQNLLSLAGRLDVGPGSVNLHGFLVFPASGLLQINWGSFICDAPWFDLRGTVYLRGGMEIDNGYFEIRNNHVYLAAHDTRSFVNARISCGGNFTAIEPGAFEPIWGSLVMEGYQSAILNVSSPNFLSALELQKEGTAVVTLAGDTTMQSLLDVISGSLDLDGNILNVLGDVQVQGVLILSPASQLRIEGGRRLSLFYGGELQALGTESDPVGIGSYTGGSYTFEVLDGCFLKAAHCVFENMGTDGIYVHAGATIDPTAAFEYCTFRNGTAGGWLIRVDNSQNLTVNGAVFPANTWSGAGNVQKAVNTGRITFIAYTGEYSGGDWESDPYNLINWQQGGIMPVQNLQISLLPGISGIRLSWQHPYPHTLFNIWAADSPDGTFSLIGNTAGLSWTGSSVANRKFYRVTAQN